jgi:hypothetical protein
MPSLGNRPAHLTALALVLGTSAGLFSGCGSSASPVALGPNQNAAASVTWVGIDDRPIAVGTQLTLTFRLPAGKTSAAEALTVSSSDPSIISLDSLDFTDDRMLVNALAPGQAAIALQGHDVQSELSVTAAKAVKIDFYDENYLAAGMWQQPLPRTGFGLLTGGQEIIGAILEDASGQMLNSRGLAMGVGHGALAVTKEEPEMFVLSRLPSAGASDGTFCGGLSAPCSEYPVTLVDAIAQVVIYVGHASDNVTVVAVAQAEDANQNPVFGVSDWQFKLSGGGFTRLAPAAVQVTPPALSAMGPVTLTATAVNEGVSGTVQLF